MNEFGELLNECLRDRDRSASWLAQRLRKHPSTISKWLSGDSRPATPGLVVLVADVLGIHEKERLSKMLHSAGFGIVEVSASGAGYIAEIQENPYAEVLESEDCSSENDSSYNEPNTVLRSTQRSKVRKWVSVGIACVGVWLLVEAIAVRLNIHRTTLIVLGILLLVLAFMLALMHNFKVELKISLNINGSFSTGLFLMAMIFFAVSGWTLHFATYDSCIALKSVVCSADCLAANEDQPTRIVMIRLNQNKECAPTRVAHSSLQIAHGRTQIYQANQLRN